MLLRKSQYGGWTWLKMKRKYHCESNKFFARAGDKMFEKFNAVFATFTDIIIDLYSLSSEIKIRNFFKYFINTYAYNLQTHVNV